MKKLFTIIAASISTLVLVFILVISLVKINIGVDINKPYLVYVYNKSVAATSSEGYKAGDGKYENVVKAMKKTTSLSVLTRLVNKTKLNDDLEIDMEGKVAKYSTDMKKNNIAIELIYDRQQDVVVHYNGVSRVISFYAIIYIIEPNNEYSDVIAYYSAVNDTTKKDTNYASCSPLVLKGTSKPLQKMLKEL